MAQRDLQALMVVGDHDYCAPRDYLTNGAKVTGGLVIKAQGTDPVMIVNPMEVEEAAASGLTVYTYYDLDWAKLLEESGGNRSLAQVGLWERALDKVGVPSGRIGVYGTADVNVYIELVRLLGQNIDQYDFVGEMGVNIFDEAAITKDAGEVARIKSVAARASAVLSATWDFIGAHRAEGDSVVKADGSPLTIGDVKRFARRTMLDHDLEDTGMIFAQGRDAGFPHSRGQADTPLQLGQAIVFDLFPREFGGGYHYDTTRTWCIGYAPEAVQRTYNEVMEAFQMAIDSYEESGQPAHLLQDAVLDYFESKGHPTSRSHPGTMEGYVHGLGHGVGLKIHEHPRMSHLAKDDVLQAGNVITIEPGLYYPESGYGVRVEDMIYIDEAGQIVTLTDFHKQLVLPLA